MIKQGFEAEKTTPVFIRKVGDGLVVLCDAEGNPISNQIRLTLDHGVDEPVKVTVTLYPEGWIE